MASDRRRELVYLPRLLLAVGRDLLAVFKTAMRRRAVLLIIALLLVALLLLLRVLVALALLLRWIALLLVAALVPALLLGGILLLAGRWVLLVALVILVVGARHDEWVDQVRIVGSGKVSVDVVVEQPKVVCALMVGMRGRLRGKTWIRVRMRRFGDTEIR